MKHIPPIAGALLGLLFIAGGATFLLGMVPPMTFVEGSPQAHFMAAFGPTGYMKFVKIFELIGGILVAIPKTRNIGLLVLGPIVLNILAYNAFVMKWEGAGKPEGFIPLLIITVLPLYLLWVGRREFAGLIRRK